MPVNRVGSRALGPQRIAFVLVAALLQACGSDGGSTAPLGDVSVTTSSPSVAITPGGTTSASLTIVRTNFSGPVVLSAENLPAGVTASFDPQPATGTSSMLTLSATSSTVPGSYNVRLRGAATGMPDATATLAVSVNTVISGARAFKTVIAGNATTCALSTVGLAYCWGLNNSGQLGNGGASSFSINPVAVAGGFTFEEIAISDAGRSVCGIRTGGSAYCWGNNDFGQLGDGTTASRSLPTLVAGGLTFQTISVGHQHACGVTHDSAVYCWGLNAWGAVGDGTVAQRLTPVAVATGLTFKSVAAADDYTCGLTQAGAAYCWGLGVFGQLGNGGTTNSLTPVAVAGGLAFNALAAGSFDVCGLTGAGTAYCWGSNTFGEVGDGTTTMRSAPVAVAGGRTYSTIAAGFEHFCAVAAGGLGYCWGYNDSAELGTGDFVNRSVPTPIMALIAGPLTFQVVSPGYSHACGVTQIVGSTNEIYCWGTNSAGELGDGTTAPTAGPFEVIWP